MKNKTENNRQGGFLKICVEKLRVAIAKVLGIFGCKQIGTK